MGKRFKLFSLLLICAFITACASSGNKEAEPGAGGEQGKKTMVIGMNNWAENIAVSNMWTILLKEKGYDVELKTMEKSPLWIGLSEGDIDLSMEAWLPTTDEPLMNKYKDKLELGEVWYKGAKTGLAVPTYVDINSIEELNANKDKFIVNGKPSIVGIDPGASLMGQTDNAIQEYGLELDVISGSEAMMLSSLGKAYGSKEPIVVTMWNPHWAFSEYELKYLEDPKKTFGEGDDISYFSRLGFKEEYPEVVKWLNQWNMDDQSLGSLMISVQDGATPEEGAKKWIDENRAVVDEWLK